MNLWVIVVFVLVVIIFILLVLLLVFVELLLFFWFFGVGLVGLIYYVLVKCCMVYCEVFGEVIVVDSV